MSDLSVEPTREAAADAEGELIVESVVEIDVVSEVEVEVEVEAETETETETEVQPALPVYEPDTVLLAASDVARSALTEITPAHTIGEPCGYEVNDEHVLTHFFVSTLPGYPGWRWAATLARVDADSPVNVLEVEMLPGEGAVVAPEWVPWSERLASYRETQARHATEEAFAAEAAAAELSDEDDVDPEDDLLENDYSDFDVELHGVGLEDGFEDNTEVDDEDDDDVSDGFGEGDDEAHSETTEEAE